MITVHWDDENLMEIYSGLQIKAKGTLVIRVQFNSTDMQGYRIQVLDPFYIPVVEKTIPKMTKGEYWQISFPLTTYLVTGKYNVIAKDDKVKKYDLVFNLVSRKRPSQRFVLETKIIATNFNKGVDRMKFNIPEIPKNYLMQSTGDYHVLGAESFGREIKVEDLLGMTQKTITWKLLVQPSFIAIDINQVRQIPDEYYLFNDISYEDEPGLELSHPKLKQYDGSKDTSHPIDVVFDVLQFVHKNMRYVRQSKERGVSYALNHGRGDCTEYSALFTVLLRKIGIKARIVSGMGRSLYNYWIPHAFAEVYMYGCWIPIDVVKPPKPYLQIGNRGELIALSRENWLDENKRDIQFSFQATSRAKPRIKLKQKVTETGLSKLPKILRSKHPLRTKLSNFFRSKRIKILENTIKVDLRQIEARSILIIEGELNFGRIVFMQYTPLDHFTIPYDQASETQSTIIVLDEFGELILRQSFEREGDKMNLIKNKSVDR